MMTAKLLLVNPDVYTLWNYRREILLRRKQNVLAHIERCSSSDTGDLMVESVEALQDDFDSIGLQELSLSEECLKRNPKSYSAWFQRVFILNNMFRPKLERELLLCNQALEKDDRNFHCWDHRRYVSRLLQISVENELSFTLDKINANFSNFSSWYQRSCLITDVVTNNIIKIGDIWPTEYSMVENAIFTDPSDQSAWFYHRWLTLTDFGNLVTKPKTELHKFDVTEVIADFSMCLFVIVLSRPVENFPRSIILKMIAFDGRSDLIVPIKAQNYLSNIWYARVAV